MKYIMICGIDTVFKTVTGIAVSIKIISEFFICGRGISVQKREQLCASKRTDVRINHLGPSYLVLDPLVRLDHQLSWP